MAITVERLEAQVSADSSAAISDLIKLEATLDVVARDRKATVNVDVDNGAAQLSALAETLQGLGSSIASGLSGATSAISGVGGAATSATTALGGMGSAGGQAGSSLSGVAGSAGSMASSLLMAIPQMAMMAGLFMGIYSAATVLMGALQMLAAAAAGLYASLFPLIGLLGAIPVGLGAIGGGIGAVVLGFSGITKALGAMDTAQGGSTRSTYNAVAAARELKSARQGIIDATKAVTRAEEELKRATEGVATAQKEAARDLVEMRRSVRNALWEEGDAIDRLKQAQENLLNVQKQVNKAQKNAARSGAILSRETDDFTGKIYEVARISADATNDAVDGAEAQAQAEKDLARAKKDAQRELIKAQENLTRSTERRKDLQTDLSEAERKGIKGSDKYKDAIRRQEDAQQGLARAHDNVAAATERLARVQEEQARRAAGGAAANNALNNAMSKLTPTGREFVRFLHDEFMPAFQKIKDAAQDGLLPGVERGLRSLMTVFPIIEKEMGLFAKGMGDAFADIMAHFTSKDAVKDLKELSRLFREVLFGDGKKTKGLTDALIPLGDIFVSITKAAGPMTKMLTNDLVNGLQGISDWMKKPENAKKMEKFFTDAYEMLKLWGPVLKPLAGILKTLSDAAKPLAEWMLKGLGGALKDVNETMKDPKGFDNLTQWFLDMKPAIKETGGLLLDILKLIFKPKDQGKEDSPFTKTIKALRTEFVPALERLFTVLGSDKESGPAFVGILTGITDAITAIVEDPTRISDFIKDVETLVQAIAGFLQASQVFLDTLHVIYKMSALGVIGTWLRIKQENDKGINEYEAYTKPKLQGAVNRVAAALDMIPIAGPLFAAAFKFITGAWLGIIGIFTSGNIGGAIAKKFASIATDIRRAFASALNPVIEMINKLGRFLPGFSPIGYIDAYKETGAGNFGTSTAGSGSGTYNPGAGTGTKPKVTTTTYTTGAKPAMRAFGGPVEGGESYIVGEKRPELLTMAPGSNGRIAAAVPRATQSTGGGITEEQLDRVLQKVLEKMKPNVDMQVDIRQPADPAAIAREIAWSIR